MVTVRLWTFFSFQTSKEEKKEEARKVPTEGEVGMPVWRYDRRM